ncbi:lipopolysaccharide biosynthesis protein [Balneola sp. MJW-20]|uniref:lipopolysaccharide biosynthesis protein n=1 Tax=Gracilimonas aurantiaca TaxID=3234185 RepID=UPI003465A0D7
MSKETSLTRKISVVVFSRMLTTLIDAATAVIIARLLSKTDFAIVGYLLMVYEVCRYVATLGFPESIFYYFEHLTKNFRKAFALQTSAILLGTAVLTAGAIFLIRMFAPQLMSEFSPEVVDQIQTFLPLLAVIAVLEIPTWPVHNVLLALDRQREAGWYQIITSAMSFAALIGPLWLGYDVRFALYGMMGYAAIRFIGSALWLMMVLPEGDLRTPKGNIIEQIRFSVPLGFSSLVNQFNKYIDKFVVSFFLTELALAEYQVGAQEVPIIRVIPFAVGSVLISRYVKLKLQGEGQSLLELWHKGIEKVALLTVPLSALFIALAPDLIPLLFETGDTNYTAAIIPFQIYNMITLMRVAHFGSILQAFGDTKGILRISINLVVLNLIFSIPMTLQFGIIGTAASTFLANLINMVILLRLIAGHLKVSPVNVLPILYYLKLLTLTVTLGAFGWAIRKFVFPEWSHTEGLLYVSVFYLTAFLLSGSALRLIEKEDWKNLGDALRLDFLWRD